MKKMLIPILLVTSVFVACSQNKPVYDFQIFDLNQIEIFDTSLVPDDYTEEDLMTGYKTVYEFDLEIYSKSDLEKMMLAYLGGNIKEAQELAKNMSYYSITVQSHDEETYNRFMAMEKLSKKDIYELLKMPSSGKVFPSLLDKDGNIIIWDSEEKNHFSKTYDVYFDNARNRNIDWDMVTLFNQGLIKNGIAYTYTNPVKLDPSIILSLEKFKDFFDKNPDFGDRMKVGCSLAELFFGYSGIEYDNSAWLLQRLRGY
jgi:hypothetical protein